MNRCYSCMNSVSHLYKPCIHCGFDPNTYETLHDYLPLGTMLQNRYMLGKVLGHGGFGITYIAFDTKLKQKMAIKEYLPKSIALRTSNGHVEVSIPKHTDKFKHFMNSFLDEAKILAKFNHEPSIVSIQDYFYENHTAYIVMGYVDGQPLNTYQKELGGRIAYSQVERYMLDVMMSLSRVHQKGLIHRDISPDNIYMTKDNTIKLLDFGAAREIIEDDQTLSIILKKGFAPLEQYSAKGKQGPWTDVYSVAATFYQLITGKRPEEPFDRLANETLKKPSDFGVDISPYKEKVLLKALAIRHENRYQNLESFMKDLTHSKTMDDETISFSSRGNFFEKKKSMLHWPILYLIILASTFLFSFIGLWIALSGMLFFLGATLLTFKKQADLENELKIKDFSLTIYDITTSNYSLSEKLNRLSSLVMSELEIDYMTFWLLI